MTTLIGTVIADGDGPALAAGTLRIGRETHHGAAGDRLTIALDTGAQQTIDAPPDGLAVAPRIEREDPWGAVADHPLARLFAAKAPGDHVEVELAGWVIAAGARVAVRVDPDTRAARSIAVLDGDGADADADADAALDRLDRELAERDARKAAALDARIAARERKREHRPAPTRAPRPWRIMPWILLVIGVGLGALAFVLEVPAGRSSHGAERQVPVMLGALFATFALVMWLSRPPFEADGDGQRRRWKHPSWAIGLLVFALLLLGIPLGAVTIELEAGSIAFAYLALVAAGGLVWCGRYHRRQLRLARLLLRARPLRSATGHGWFEGEVDGKAVVIGRHTDYVLKSRSYTETVTLDGGGTTTRERTSSWYEGVGNSSPLRPFRIMCGDRRVKVTGDRASWGAPLAYKPRKKPEIRFATEATIRDGDRVVVLARVVDDGGAPQIHATGVESLVMFGAPEQPRRTLARLTFAWLAQAALVLAIAVAGAGYAVYLAIASPTASTSVAPEAKPPPRRPVPAERP